MCRRSSFSVSADTRDVVRSSEGQTAMLNHVRMGWIPRVGMRAYGNNVYNGSVTTNTNPNSFCNPLYAWLPVSRQSCDSCVSPVCLELDQLVFTAGCFVPQYGYEAWFPQIPVTTSQFNSGPVPIYPLDSSLVGVGTQGSKKDSTGGQTAHWTLGGKGCGHLRRGSPFLSS